MILYLVARVKKGVNKMEFKKKNSVVENDKVILMINEGCSNSGCTGNNLGTCTSNNNTTGCGR